MSETTSFTLNKKRHWPLFVLVLAGLLMASTATYATEDGLAWRLIFFTAILLLMVATALGCGQRGLVPAGGSGGRLGIHLSTGDELPVYDLPAESRLQERESRQGSGRAGSAHHSDRARRHAPLLARLADWGISGKRTHRVLIDNKGGRMRRPGKETFISLTFISLQAQRRRAAAGLS